MMTKERQGEIALLVLKAKIKRDGVRLGAHTKREIGNTAKELGVPVEEATEFMEILVRELVEQTFPHIKFGVPTPQK